MNTSASTVKPPPSAAGIELRGIGKRFGRVVANSGINMKVGKGEIHGLLGENGAGKSTLMNILFGLVQQDEGDILINGEVADIRSPFDAEDYGIGMVHQHFQLVPNMTVAENFALLGRGKWLSNDIDEISTRISELSKHYRFGIDPKSVISDLSVGQQQRVEILKLLSADTRVMVLDEPTAVLTPEEWVVFAEQLHHFADEGRSVIFISHKMKEQFDVSHNCTILRRGQVVGSLDMSEATEDQIVRMMVGRPLAEKQRRVAVPQEAKEVLNVSGLVARSDDGRTLLDDISFTLREGETLGIAGVDGNGQEELVDAIIGLLPLKSGRVELNGEDVTGKPPALWRDNASALITADRHATAIALDLSVAENMLVTTADKQGLLNMGLFKHTETTEFVDKRIRDYDVQGGFAETPIRGLSGGNQQKVVLARELGQKANVAFVAQPTRGLDINAAQSVYGYLNEHKKNGGATLLISTEIDELLDMSDRIAVILRGRIIGVLENDETFEFDELAHLMAGEEH